MSIQHTINLFLQVVEPALRYTAIIVQVHTPCSPLPNSLHQLLPTLLSLLLFLQTCVSGFKFSLALTFFNQMERKLTYSLGNEMSPLLLENLILPLTQHPRSAQSASSAAQPDLVSPMPTTPCQVLWAQLPHKDRWKNRY